MTDTEIIAKWMEPNPGVPIQAYQISPLMWWKARYRPAEKRLCWCPHDRSDSLDGLWEVEHRMSGRQWSEYIHALNMVLTGGIARVVDRSELTHSTPEQKIAALAAVLRPIAENKEPLQQP